MLEPVRGRDLCLSMRRGGGGGGSTPTPIFVNKKDYSKNTLLFTIFAHVRLVGIIISHM